MASDSPVGIQHDLHDPQVGKVGKYQNLVVGKKGVWSLLKYEIIAMLCANMPGALGLLLRSKLYPRLLGASGRNVNFGMNVVLRHPHKIKIGDNVVIDDNCLLDAKGSDNNGIVLGSGTFIGRNTILSCKNGDIEIGENANIGFNCEIFSASKVVLGKNALFAAYCYLIGGEHTFDRTDVSVLEQQRTSAGIKVGDNVWLGAGVKVNDGASIGRDSIIGTSAVVRGNIPEYSIAVGIPAKVIKSRKK
ncbi:acyltransferase [candidate division KSB1 bacterium]|nr:acyltransferase [candidate division KSB1 bacterium]